MTDWENKDIQPIGKQHQLKNPLKMRGMLGDALKNIYIYFIYLFLAVLGLRCCVGFSIVAASSDYSLAMIHGFSLQGLLLLQSMACNKGSMGFSSCASGFSSCSSWTLEHRLSSCGTDLVAPKHVGSSQIRN